MGLFKRWFKGESEEDPGEEQSEQEQPAQDAAAADVPAQPQATAPPQGQAQQHQQHQPPPQAQPPPQPQPQAQAPQRTRQPPSPPQAQPPRAQPQDRAQSQSAPQDRAQPPQARQSPAQPPRAKQGSQQAPSKQQRSGAEQPRQQRKPDARQPAAAPPSRTQRADPKAPATARAQAKAPQPARQASRSASGAGGAGPSQGPASKAPSSAAGAKGGAATAGRSAAKPAASKPSRASSPPTASSKPGDDDIDAQLDSLFDADGGGVEADATSESDLAAVRETFEQLAPAHMRPVRDFMLEVQSGEAPAEWIAMCVPPVRTLREMAGQLEMTDLSRALDRLLEALDGAAGAGSARVVGGAARDALLSAYSPLVGLVPGAFELNAERNRREPHIVRSLLYLAPGVHKVTADKVYAAGLTRLSALLAARPDEIAATAGIGEELAASIARQFRAYRDDFPTEAPDPKRTRELGRLAELVSELRRQHESFEKAAAGWSDEHVRERKRARRERQTTLRHVHVVLARLGEVDRLAELERLPYARKIETLDGFLRNAKAA